MCLTELELLLNTEFDTLDIYRGDLFQILFQEASFSIYTALSIRLSLKVIQTSVDIGQIIGFDTIDCIRGVVKTSFGEVFTFSGIGLDGLKGTYYCV